MYSVVIRSAVHAETRCPLAITTLHPRLNLRNLAFEAGKERGTLQERAALVGICWFATLGTLETKDLASGRIKNILQFHRIL
jgi:hypothetical protein